MADVLLAHGRVTSDSACGAHAFSKPARAGIRLVEGVGVEGDAHMGVTVKHRSRVAQDPTQPNLRQVHLIPAELHEELQRAGFRGAPGVMGENITTHDIDLLNLQCGARLHLGQTAVVEITGLRNPCRQLDAHQPGLMAAVLERNPDGAIVRKVGVMGIVLVGGEVRPGDAVGIALPPGPHRGLERV